MNALENLCGVDPGLRGWSSRKNLVSQPRNTRRWFRQFLVIYCCLDKSGGGGGGYSGAVVNLEHSASNTRTRKSGTQSLSLSLSLSRAEHASQQAVSGSFCGSYALMVVCFASCHASFVFPRRVEGTDILGMFP